MGKIRVKTLGDEAQEKEQAKDAKKRREEKKAKKEHTKGVGLKGGQQVVAMEGVQLTAEAEAAVAEAEGKEAKKTKKAKTRVRSKRYTQLRELVDRTKQYDLKKAIDLVKKTATTKFDGSVEVHINLNPATLSKEKKNLSGSVNLPHGTGKKRTIVIANDEILTQIEAGKINFDVLVAHPSLMPKLAKFARVLGPKGLMPNPKNGTVSPTPEKRAEELAGGETNWKTEADHPIIHQVVGKVSFEEKQLTENLRALTKAIDTSKIAKLTLSSSMGPGIQVDVSTL